MITTYIKSMRYFDKYICRENCFDTFVFKPYDPIKVQKVRVNGRKDTMMTIMYIALSKRGVW